jgi:hypothetical protein
MKMSNLSYLKIVRIGDVCIKTNVGFHKILELKPHFLDFTFLVNKQPLEGIIPKASKLNLK